MFPNFYVTHLCSSWCTLRNKTSSLQLWMDGGTALHPCIPFERVVHEIRTPQQQAAAAGHCSHCALKSAKNLCNIFFQCKVWLILKTYIPTLLNKYVLNKWSCKMWPRTLLLCLISMIVLTCQWYLWLTRCFNIVYSFFSIWPEKCLIWTFEDK